MKDKPCALSLVDGGIRELGFPQSDGLFEGKIAVSGAGHLAERCRAYLEEISLFNAAFGLVSADCSTPQGREEVAVRHILDSLSPWREIARLLIACSPGRDFAREPLCICDAGSGAGLPGIPLALSFPQARFALVERMQRRCSFLQNCAAALSLDNVSVVNKEIERSEKGAFDAVVFRAFRPLDEDKILKSLLRLLRPQGACRKGFLAAYKGKRSAFAAEERKLRGGGFLGKIEARDVAAPFLNEERLVAFIFSD